MFTINKLRLYILNILLLMFVTVNGQNAYQPGYFIKNNGDTIRCLIFNKDWLYNPTSFNYKTVGADTREEAGISTVKEFGIDQAAVYIRKKVKIDRSPEEINSLSDSKEPQWSDEVLFLKVVVKGSACLYEYHEAGLYRYFFSLADTAVNQLIFKEYFVDGKIARNNTYMQQLYAYVNCNNVDQNQIRNIEYVLNDLKKYFSTYNQCRGDYILKPLIQNKKPFYNLTFCSGINLAFLSLSNSVYSGRNFKTTDVSLRVSAESEFYLPFNNNKIGFIIDPGFQYLNTEQDVPYGAVSVNYKSIEFPFGMRYHFYLKNNRSVYVGACYIPLLNMNMNSTIRFENDAELKIKVSDAIAFDAGFEFKRFQGQVRYYTVKSLLSSYVLWNAGYQRLSFTLGYKVIDANRERKNH